MIKNLESFFDNLKNEVERTGLEFKSDWFIDHICFRTSSLKEYKDVVLHYTNEHELLIESPVGGRLISTFRLNQPLLFMGYQIPLIEIPMPKEGRVTRSGYEHIEIVITESFKELQAGYPEVKFLTHALKKEINPELEIEMKDCSIKFHHQSLEEVIRFEKGII
jgi:predicted metalloenzyme YecM